MSVSHRSIARLPISIFSNLAFCPTETIENNKNNGDDVEKTKSLQSNICQKLFRYYHQLDKNTTTAITVGDILQIPVPILITILDPLLTYGECEELIRRICEMCSPTPVTAKELLLRDSSSSSPELLTKIKTRINNNVIGTGMSRLDNHLKGGFRKGQISEIVGRAGVGKTQLALQLCIQTALHNNAYIVTNPNNRNYTDMRPRQHSRGCSIYIDTEKKMSLQRLQQMTMEQLSYHSNTQNTSETHDMYDKNTYMDSLSLQQQLQHQQQQILDSITIHSISSMTELLSYVSQRLEEEILWQNNNNAFDENEERNYAPAVSLIVLDSIAAPMKRDYDSSNSHHSRVSILFQIAQRLKRIADQLQVAIVIINQIDSVSSSKQPSLNFIDNNSNHYQNNKSEKQVELNQREGSDFVPVQAALGTSWHHCVTTRLLLEHERDPHRIETATDIAHKNHVQQTNGNDGLFELPNDATATAPAWMSERGHVRTATIIKSNITGRHTMSYQIKSRGVCQT